MEYKIFYSWQSDLPNSTNRGFIQKALDKAVKSLKTDNDSIIDPVIDRDTAGVPGSPDIVKEILDKIKRSQAFVCDVSIINRGSARPSPNPNILIELGYAIHALDDKRIIMVMNTAFGEIEELPFDIKTRRVIAYKLTENQTDKAQEREKIEKILVNALKGILSFNVPPPTPLERLQLFVETEQCQYLLSNPNKVGYRSISEPILLSGFFAIVSLFVLINSLHAFTQYPQSPGAWSFYINVLWSIIWLGILVISTRNLVPLLRKLYQGIDLIPQDEIVIMPVFIYSEPSPINVKFDKEIEEADKIILVDSQQERHEVVQRRLYRRPVLIAEDVGVVFLRKELFGSLGWRSVVIDFVRASEQSR